MNFHNIYEINKYLNNKTIRKLSSLSKYYILYRSSYLFNIKGYLLIDVIRKMKHSKIPDRNKCLDLEFGIGLFISGFINIDKDLRKTIDIIDILRLCKGTYVVKNVTDHNSLKKIGIRPKIVHFSNKHNGKTRR